MEWRTCPVDPLQWIDLRESLLTVFLTPALLILLVLGLMLLAAWILHAPPLTAGLVALLVSLAVAALYSPLSA